MVSFNIGLGNMRHLFLSIASLCIVFLATLTSTSYANSNDETLLLARAAYDQKNAIALSEYAQQLQSQQYILAPYAE